MTPLLWAILAYVVVQMSVGAWAFRRIATETDYWVAGRKLGPTLAVFSVFATWFGAETCIGSAGAVHDEGLAGGSADPFGYGAALLVMGALLAAPLWRRQLTTLADLFRARYSRGVERLAVLLMVPTSLLWAAAQIRAFAQVLSASSDLGLEITMLVAAVCVVVYSTFGGLLADAVTDTLQGVVLIVGLLVLAVVLMLDPDTGFRAALASAPAERLDLVARSDSWLVSLDRWAIPVLGSLVAQELISRVSASRSAQLARGAVLTAAVLYLVVGSIPATIGLVGPTLVPGLTDGEQVLPRVAEAILPFPLHVLFVGALVSAILSTVDSALLAAASLLTHNLVGSFRPQQSERTRLRLARAGVVACGLVAFVLARQADSVYELVESSSAFGSAGLLVVMLMALTRSGGGSLAAGAALLAGAGVWAVGSDGRWLELEAPYLTSLAAALGSYAVVAVLEIGWRRWRA